MSSAIPMVDRLSILPAPNTPVGARERPVEMLRSDLAGAPPALDHDLYDGRY